MATLTVRDERTIDTTDEACEELGVKPGDRIVLRLRSGGRFEASRLEAPAVSVPPPKTLADLIERYGADERSTAGDIEKAARQGEAELGEEVAERIRRGVE